MSKNKQVELLWIVFIALFTFSLFKLVYSFPMLPMGESDDYIMSAIAFKNHFSSDIRHEDLEDARINFTNYYEGYIKNNFKDNPEEFELVAPNGKIYPYYLPTYSIFCIPVMFILELMGATQSYAFRITNIMLLIFATLYARKQLQAPLLLRTMLSLMILFSPALFYLLWPSAEIFIFTSVVISLVCFWNKQYHKAALAVSIGATLNQTIMGYGIIILLFYITEKIKDFNKDKIKTDLFDLILLALCFLPSIFPFIFYYFNFGYINPMVNKGGTMDSLGLIIQRMFAYFFDLNLGFFPYFPILTVLFFIVLFLSVYKKYYFAVFLALGLLTTMFGYSLMIHINSGMTCIARYNTWSYPIMLFVVFSFLVKCNGCQKIIKYFSIISILFFLTQFMCSLKFPERYKSIVMLPLPSFILEHYPSIYNPFPYTFVSRVDNVDGGYYYNKPVIYTGTSGYIRKILTTPSTANDIKSMILGSKNDLIILDNKISLLNNNNFQYINLPYPCKLVDITNRYIDSKQNEIIFTKRELPMSIKYISGLSHVEQWGRWSDANVASTVNVVFFKSLPDVFKLSLHATAFAPNVSDILTINIGSHTYTVQIPNTGPFEINLIINLDGEKSYNIEFIPPRPTSPYELGISSDNRKLGVGFIDMKIIPIEGDKK